MPRIDAPLAWVESPLQLIGAAEWAAAHRRVVDVAGRLTPQVEETAAELTARRARFAEQAGYYGIPWRALRAHDHWLIGDGFSGQFRLAAALLRPRWVTFLDDGLNAVAFADAVTGARPFRRPGIAERGLGARVAPFALDVIRLRAAAGRAELFTAFPLGEARLSRLRDLGLGVQTHAFEWLRASRGRGEPRVPTEPRVPEERIILGSARVTDGHLSPLEYLDWVRAHVGGGASYLPHRRESEELLGLVAGVPGIRVVRTGLPIELLLSGHPRPLDITTLPSSAAVTLRRVLEGTGSVVRESATRSGTGVDA